MFGAILKATNSSFQQSMLFCLSIYMKKVMKLLTFIFEQPSHLPSTTPFYASVSKGAASTIFFYTFGMVWPGFEPTTSRSEIERPNRLGYRGGVLCCTTHYTNCRTVSICI